MVVIGVIPLEQDKVHVSTWIIFACSLVFAATGMVAFLYPLRDKYPAAYCLQRLCSSPVFSVQVCWSPGILKIFISHISTDD